jgi:hypothetical protein
MSIQPFGQTDFSGHAKQGKKRLRASNVAFGFPGSPRGEEISSLSSIFAGLARPPEPFNFFCQDGGVLATKGKNKYDACMTNCSSSTTNLFFPTTKLKWRALQADVVVFRPVVFGPWLPSAVFFLRTGVPSERLWTADQNFWFFF